MSPGWRAFRPAIWLAMLGVALALLVSPPYFGAVLIGAGIGLAIRIRQRRGPPAGPTGRGPGSPRNAAGRRRRKSRR
jgi:hypothetical protein